MVIMHLQNVCAEHFASVTGTIRTPGVGAQPAARCPSFLTATSAAIFGGGLVCRGGAGCVLSGALSGSWVTWWLNWNASELWIRPFTRVWMGTLDQFTAIPGSEVNSGWQSFASPEVIVQRRNWCSLILTPFNQRHFHINWSCMRKLSFVKLYLNRQVLLCTRVTAEAVTDCSGGKTEPGMSYHV